MNFSQTKQNLIQLFQDHDYKGMLERKEPNHQVQLVVETLPNKTEIIISFTGYKGKITKYGVTYDFRVDLKRKDGFKTSLSHANIICDIIGKLNNGVDGGIFLNLIKESAFDKPFDLDIASYQLPEVNRPPASELLEEINKSHYKRGKSFNKNGNNQDLSLVEFFQSLKYIVIQEDLNYPMPRFEGRAMCYARYVEAFHVARSEGHRTLDELIGRTLSHRRPERWGEVDYSFIDKIKRDAK